MIDSGCLSFDDALKRNTGEEPVLLYIISPLTPHPSHHLVLLIIVMSILSIPPVSQLASAISPEEDTGAGVVQLAHVCQPYRAHVYIVYMHDVTLSLLLLSPHY